MDDTEREWFLNHCQEAYDYQLTRSENIAGRLSLLSGLLTALGGGIYYVGTSYPHALKSAACLFFYLPFSLSLLLFGISVVLYLRTLTGGFLYNYVTTTPEIIQYMRELESFNAANQELAVVVLADIKDNMIKEYSNNELLNFNRNSQRSISLLNATRMSALSLVLLALSLPFYFYQKTTCSSEPAKVIIINPVKFAP